MTLPVFVQAKTGNAGAWVAGVSNGSSVPNVYGDPDIRYVDFVAAPTAGNRLFMLLAYEDPRFPFELDMAGWTLVSLMPGQTGYTDDTGAHPSRWGLYTRVVGVGESSHSLVAYNLQARGITIQGMYQLVEYAGLDVVGAVTWVADTLVLPSLTPDASSDVLLLAAININPHYVPTWPSGWTERSRTTTGEATITQALGDRIVSAASGTYNGALTIGGALNGSHLGALIATSPAGGSGAQIVVV